MKKQPKVSVIIPTLSKNPKTLESIPNCVEVLIITEGNRSEARNKGAYIARGDILVFCDDDIIFTEDFFWNVIRKKRKREIIGLEDYDFGLLLTRFLVVGKDEFMDIGGFDESLNHMEDTDFCIRAREKGYKLVIIPRDLVTHIEHETRINIWERRLYYLRLLKKHKFKFLMLLLKMLAKKIKI